MSNASLYEGVGGYYFPDAVIDPFIAAARQVKLPPSIPSVSSKRRFSLEESKSLIIGAMNEFDPKLGVKAAEILSTASFNNTALKAGEQNPYLAEDYKLPNMEDSRWNLMQVEPGQSRLMRCLPAESEQKDYGGDGYDPANPHPHAVIEYQFDGTIDGVIHMAHEMGHMIADDYQREAGSNYRDNPEHLKETQAYLTQHILYDYLKRHADPEIADSARQHYSSTMMQNIQDLSDNDRLHERSMSILTAGGLAKHLQGQNLAVRRSASEMLQGLHGPVDITEVLAAAGIERDDDMQRLAVAVVGRSIENGLERRMSPAITTSQSASVVP